MNKLNEVRTEGSGRLCRFLSLILRHRPKDIGIKVDANGWADVEEILMSMGITMKTLIALVDDNPQKFMFNSDKTRIRSH